MKTNDIYLRRHFLTQGAVVSNIDDNERTRISETVAMIPQNWKCIVDVGCGDGRIGLSLEAMGREVVGIDWSNTSLRAFSNNSFVADLRKDWPCRKVFDGAICAEVLEHMPVAEARSVIQQMRHSAKHGFIISVPARESLASHSTVCPDCRMYYHVWGHVQKFDSFQDVDDLVELDSVCRKFVPYNGVRPSPVITRLRHAMGTYVSSDFAVCPFCGAKLPVAQRPFLPFLCLLWSLGKIEKLTNCIRREVGWFICRYEK